MRSFAVILKGRERIAVGRGRDKKQLLIMLGVMLISGASASVNNKFNLYLSGVMDSAVFFPIVNCGGLVLATVASVLILR